ncbi:MAG: GNAT family N-acetyltransferase, partial [Bacteroidales bacterium]|nr:GNAT family N-acetyltransferase [Bacteroidales bacterium]
NLRAGIGIMIMDEYQNKGHASEALELVIQYGFEQLGLHQLYCNITADNENSKKLFERQGFRQTGIKKEWIRKNNHWLDEAFYQLLKDSAGH